MTETTRTVFTAEDFDHLANSMEWPEDFRALTQAAAQARVIEKLKDAMDKAVSRKPPLTGLVSVQLLERLLTEEGLAP